MALENDFAKRRAELQKTPNALGGLDSGLQGGVQTAIAGQVSGEAFDPFRASSQQAFTTAAENLRAQTGGQFAPNIGQGSAIRAQQGTEQNILAGLSQNELETAKAEQQFRDVGVGRALEVSGAQEQARQANLSADLGFAGLESGERTALAGIESTENIEAGRQQFNYDALDAETKLAYDNLSQNDRQFFEGLDRNDQQFFAGLGSNEKLAFAEMDSGERQFYSSLDQANQQFYDGLDSNEQMFYEGLSQEDQQFYSSLDQNDAQFYADLEGTNRRHFASMDATERLAMAELGQNDRHFLSTMTLEEAKVELARTQFDSEFDLAERGMVITEANAESDAYWDSSKKFATHMATNLDAKRGDKATDAALAEWYEAKYGESPDIGSKAYKNWADAELAAASDNRLTNPFDRTLYEIDSSSLPDATKEYLKTTMSDPELLAGMDGFTIDEDGNIIVGEATDVVEGGRSTEGYDFSEGVITGPDIAPGNADANIDVYSTLLRNGNDPTNPNNEFYTKVANSADGLSVEISSASDNELSGVPEKGTVVNSGGRLLVVTKSTYRAGTGTLRERDKDAFQVMDLATGVKKTFTGLNSDDNNVSSISSWVDGL